MGNASAKKWILLIPWLLGLLAVGVGGTRPDGYRICVLGDPGPNPYPMAGVLYFGISLMHMPDSIYGHFLWLCALVVSMLVLFCVSLFGSLSIARRVP